MAHPTFPRARRSLRPPSLGSSSTLPRRHVARGLSVFVCAAAVLACTPPPRCQLPAPEGVAYAGPIFDVHTHLLVDGDPAAMNPTLPATVPVLLAELDRAGIGHANAITIAPRGDLPRTRQNNDALLAVARASGGRLTALGSVHPDDGDAALAEIDRLAAEGAVGLKLHPTTQGVATGSPAMHAVIARAAEAGLPVLIDGYSPFEAGQLGAFVVLAMAHPTARIVIAHMGGPRFAELAVLIGFLKKQPGYTNNLWVDLSATAALYAGSPLVDQVAWALRRIGVDRVLFGSDFPVFSPADAVASVRALGLSAAEAEAVFHGNAEALFSRPSR